MSEHRHNTTRYWVRMEPGSSPDSGTISEVYFTTESNAAHTRAEDDQYAREITAEEYAIAVPPEARSKPYSEVQAQGTALPPTEVIQQYRAQCAANMIQVHQQVIQLLTSTDITHAERIFILEMVKTELMQSMFAPAKPVH